MSFASMLESGTLLSWCKNEADKADFLTKAERDVYARALLDAVFWALAH